MEFLYLPAYANFLLDNKLEAFVKEQLAISKKLEIPLLKYFESFGEQALLDLGKVTVSELLDYLIKNKPLEYIQDNLKKWQANQLPIITRSQIRPEDITLVSLVRRNVFRKFLPEFAYDIKHFSAIMEEVDLFTTKHDTESFNFLIQLQQELYQKSQSIAHIGDWRWNLTDQILSWSDELYRIYELEPQSEIPNENIAAFTHPEDRDMVHNKLQQSLESLQPHDFSYRIRLADGRLKTLQTKGEVLLDDNQQPYETFGTVQDVTEQYLLTEELEKRNIELKKSEERYHKMTNEVEEYAIILLSKDGVIENWNKGAEKIKGYKPEEIIGKNFSIFYTPEDRKSRLPENLMKMATIEGKSSHEGWRVKKDGSRFWGYTIITALHDDYNEVVAFSKVTRDLTTKKLAEEKLNEYIENIGRKNEELSRINSELDSFTYMASHDLQEPLRKIITFSDLLISNNNEHLTNENKKYLSRISGAALRMRNLIQNLLSYSRTGIMETEKTDMNKLLKEVEKNLSQIIKEKKAKIYYKKLPFLHVAPSQFQQLFSNLIQNAIKYSKEDIPPEINITIEKVAANEIISDSLEKNFYKILVSDNGIGFEKEFETKIFQLFQRLHTKDYAGTGIGLAICKKIVLNHNGMIKAIGEPGIGATFIIYIPEDN